MDTLQCAVVLAKLQRFEWEIAQRVRIGQRYLDLLEELPVQTMTVGPDNTCVWAQFTVLVTQREQVIAQLKEAGIPTAVHYPRPIHVQPAYTQYAKTGELPVAEDWEALVVTLPMHAGADESTTI